MPGWVAGREGGARATGCRCPDAACLGGGRVGREIVSIIIIKKVFTVKEEEEERERLSGVLRLRFVGNGENCPFSYVDPW